MGNSSFRSDCLRGHTILITGGAGAIGRVVTQTLAHHGARVAVNDIHPQEEGERIIGGEKDISYFFADITNEAEVARLFDAIEGALGVPTVVCCHAGVVESSAYAALSARNFDRTLDVNLRGAFLVSREAMRRMKGTGSASRPGRIIFTTSWVQDVPWPEIAAYCASKSAVKMLMRTLAREVARDHIRVNAVARGDSGHRHGQETMGRGHSISGTRAARGTAGLSANRGISRRRIPVSREQCVELHDWSHVARRRGL